MLVAVVGAVGLRMSHAATPGTVYDRVKIVNTAEKEVGNREYNARVREYTGRSDQPEWCAYFVSWVMKASGYPLRTGATNWRVPAVFASDNNLKDLFIQMGAWVENKPKQFGYPRQGDIVLFGRSHTGIVRFNMDGSQNGSRLYTVEGNSGFAGKPNSVATPNYDSLDAAGIVGWGNVDPFINRSPSKK